MSTKHFAIALSFLIAFGSTVNAQKLKTKNDSVTYNIALSVLLSMQEQGYTKLDKKIMSQTIDSFNKGKIKPEQRKDAEAYLQVFFRELYELKNKEVKDEGENFLAKNGKRESVVTLESGLQYEPLVVGKGQLPKNGDRVKVHYHGTLVDGSVFDSSIERGQPASFGVNQVIRGWTEALLLMPVGSKYKLYIPYQLAYGERGSGAKIKPYAALIFEVELLEIETPPSQNKMP